MKRHKLHEPLLTKCLFDTAYECDRWMDEHIKMAKEKEYNYKVHEYVKYLHCGSKPSIPADVHATAAAQSCMQLSLSLSSSWLSSS